MPSNEPTYSNFKEAYCAFFRCSSEDYVRHLLCRSVPFHFRFLASVTYRMNPGLFSSEIDVLNQMGRCTSGRDIGLAIGELDSLRRVERSFWRTVGLRADAERLLAAWRDVREYIARTDSWEPGPMAGPTATVAPASKPAPAPSTASAAPAPSAPRETISNRESPAMILRKLRQMHADITSGRPLAEVLAESEMTEETFVAHLEVHGKTNPSIAWLLGQMRLGSRIRELEAENRGLMKLLAQTGRDVASGPSQSA